MPELLRDLLPVLLIHVIALGIEADVVGAIRQEEGGACQGEAHPDKLPRLGGARLGLSLAGIDILYYLHLEHVAARLHSHSRACSSKQVLKATLRERHQELATDSRHDVQGGICGADTDGVGFHLGPGVCRRILLQLLRLLRFLWSLFLSLLLLPLHLRIRLLLLRLLRLGLLLRLLRLRLCRRCLLHLGRLLRLLLLSVRHGSAGVTANRSPRGRKRRS
mmetsp:Transcript_55930/g.120364  ORF Transcript_55930/g.120364 Transcript_55930/m.120364 type:complete len:220 (+) Transcript_55930:2143-2802(+)